MDFISQLSHYGVLRVWVKGGADIAFGRFKSDG